MKELYTIGYSCFDINRFLEVLRQYSINCVIDVRSNPKSQYYPEYNIELLETFLKKNNILYRNYKKEFGARQEETIYYTNGVLDFSKFTKSKIFQEGIEKIDKGINLGYRFVLMCAEKDPSTCHRNIMIAKWFYENGYNIYNILCDGTLEKQDELEKRMLDVYFPNRNQYTLFGEMLTEEEMIKECYSKRNLEIGFKISNLIGDEHND